MVELAPGIVELITTLDELSLGFTVTVTCNEVDRTWENCDRVALTSRVGCTTSELVLNDADCGARITVVFNDCVTTDNTRVELALTEAVDNTLTETVDDMITEDVEDMITEDVEDMLTGSVDTKLGCTILVVYTT